jgi:peptidoglycan/LPS O-acetylase OafA/YrhL
LAYEVVFYALAAVAFGLRLSDRTLTIVAMLWIVAVNLFAANPTDTEYEFPGPTILLCAAVQVFPMGLICGIHVERLRRVGRWPYLLACVVAFAASLPLAELTVLKLLLHGINASFLILALADLDIRSRIVKFLGDASYGIYLLHFLAMTFVAAYFQSLGFWWFFFIGMASGTLFGLFDHHLYRRLIRLVRRHDDPFGAVRL